MRIEVTVGDASQVAGDVLVLKYAQARYGLDAAVADELRRTGREEREMSPRPDGFRILQSPSGIVASCILFVGVVPINQFGYREIRAFGRKVLATLAGERPATRTVVATVHGPGYGLDEIEAFESQVAGFVDAILSGDRPDQLECIRIVERNQGRATRLQTALARLLPDGEVSAGPLHVGDGAAERLRAAGYSSASKKHVFVAMPFADEMEDVYHYGIQNAVNSVGLLCERADLSAFTGDVMQRVTQRIKTASLVIADLTGANPNVYLELGFAWGCGKSSILLARDSNELRFDARGQRCLLYKSIKDLEAKLSSELHQLGIGNDI